MVEKVKEKAASGESVVCVRDITDIRFGRLVPKSIQYTKNNKRYWLCQCDCGQQTVVRQDQITTGKSTSCC